MHPLRERAGTVSPDAPARRDPPRTAPAARNGSPARRNRFRADIEGLRAVAVLGVVLYHAHVGVLRGGFAGVDVFFVVSGYLITGLLWAELEKKRRVNFAAFYGRRARRLLPASILVIVVTAIAARHWLPPLQTSSVVKDGIASALYVGNYRFAFAQTNYLNGSAPSPYQHYWSLGVEEQFYLLWPLLLVGGAYLWSRRRGRMVGRHAASRLRPDRATAIGVLAAVTLVSFFLSLWLTHANQPWAFFSLPTRAWQLGAGGLLALGAPAIKRVPPVVASVVGWAGLATTVASFLLLSNRTPFPGTAALMPVLGTAATLAAGEALTANLAEGIGPIQILGRTPMRFMGRISYSWYLWHWPVLILAPYAVGHTLHLWGNLVAAGFSGVLATLSFLFIEAPARSSAWLTALPRRSLATGGALSATGAAACLIASATLPSLTGHGLAAAAHIRTGPTPTPHVGHAAEKSGALDPLQAQLASIISQISTQVAQSVNDQTVPANLTPTLTHAKHDDPVVFHDGCMDSYLDSAVADCAFGDLASTTSVALVGDSHAAMWFPALDAAANDRHFKLYVWTKATCPPLYNLPIISPVLGRNFTECDTWRHNVLNQVATLHPTMVVLAMARHYTSIYGFTPYQPPWIQGLGQMVANMRRLGTKVAVIGPVPKPPFYVPDCLSAHLESATACTVPVALALSLAGIESERETVEGAGGIYIDTRPWFCTARTCTAMVGNLLVWRDDNHISATYSAFLGPVMSAELATVLRAP